MLNQTFFFTHLMPRVYPHPVSMTVFSFFIKYYGVFLMLFIVWHLTRTMSLFETIDNRISSCEDEIQNLKRKRGDLDDRDEMFELGDFLPKRQRVFRRYPRTQFNSAFDESIFNNVKSDGEEVNVDDDKKYDDKKYDDKKDEVDVKADVKVEESLS